MLVVDRDPQASSRRPPGPIGQIDRKLRRDEAAVVAGTPMMSAAVLHRRVQLATVALAARSRERYVVCIYMSGTFFVNDDKSTPRASWWCGGREAANEDEMQLQALPDALIVTVGTAPRTADLVQLQSKLEPLGAIEHLILDVTAARDMDDAVLARLTAMLRQCGRVVTFRGLSLHQQRMLEYIDARRGLRPQRTR